MKLLKMLGLGLVVYLVFGLFYSVISFKWWRSLRQQKNPNARWFLMYGTMGIVSLGLMATAFMTAAMDTRAGLMLLACMFGIGGSTRQMHLVGELKRSKLRQGALPASLLSG